MAQQQVENLPAWFTEVSRFGEKGEYDRALKVVNRILHFAREDEKAFHCKVVCLIQLSQFDEALKLLKNNPKLGSSLSFEKAYCEYRLNRTEDALATIQSVAKPDSRLQELLGQVLYRLERYSQCCSAYKDLLKNTQDDYEEERETNLSAAMAALKLWGDEEPENVLLREDTYELYYNAACLDIGREQYSEALEKLQQAEELCRKMHEDDPDVTTEDCETELSIVWTQMAYTLQKLGQNEAAMKLYNQVMKQRQADVALAAVASNNIITLNKDQNVFDSKKKIKVATADGVQQKLTSSQRQAISLNECLLYMYTGQVEQCRHLAETLISSYPECDTPGLIQAAQYVRQKNVGQAIECLQAQLDNGADMLRLKLALAQLYLYQEHIYKACDVLWSLGDLTFSPGVVGTLVTLYSSQEDQTSATDVLSKAISWYQSNDPQSPSLPMLIRASAKFHLRLGSPQVAAELLQELHRQNPDDLKTLAQLVSAYSMFDPQTASSVSRQLPPANKFARDIDVDSLESSLSLLSSKHTKKTTASSKSEASPRDNVASPNRNVSDVVVKKKKKKKKAKLPKNCDPNSTPDPERWLPLRERTYYRGKRKSKKRDAVGKGTQGAAMASTDLDASKPSTSSPPSSSVSSPKPGTSAAAPSSVNSAATSSNASSAAGPRQQKPQPGKPARGGKKKKGAKW